MFQISKQLTCQKFIYKLHSSRLRKHRWRLTLPIEEARRNEEVRITYNTKNTPAAFPKKRPIGFKGFAKSGETRMRKIT